MWCAGPTSTNPWNALPQHLQECILMHLPLQDLGRTVQLGRAFWFAFQQRLSQVEDSLTSIAVATFGQPLLESLAVVLQRYRQRTDLATGCGPMRFEESVTVDTSGTITAGETYTNHRYNVGPLPVNARVRLHSRPRTKDHVAMQSLSCTLVGADGGNWAADLSLLGPTQRSSTMHRNDSAILCITTHTPSTPSNQPRWLE
jgi:hypothetical protein